MCFRCRVSARVSAVLDGVFQDAFQAAFQDVPVVYSEFRAYNTYLCAQRVPH